jgi:hypothetical protein
MLCSTSQEVRLFRAEVEIKVLLLYRRRHYDSITDGGWVIMCG